MIVRFKPLDSGEIRTACRKIRTEIFFSKAEAFQHQKMLYGFLGISKKKPGSNGWRHLGYSPEMRNFLSGDFFSGSMLNFGGVHLNESNIGFQKVNPGAETEFENKKRPLKRDHFF